MQNDSASEPLVYDPMDRYMVSRGWSAFWSLVYFLVICAALAALGMSIYATVRVNQHSGKINTLRDKTSGLTTHHVITGTHPDDDDVNVIRNLYVGHNAYLNGTTYSYDGFVARTGGASLNDTLTVTYGDITAEHGNVVSQCINEQRVFNVSGQSAVSIARGDVVSLLNGEVRKGFRQHEDQQVVSSIGASTSANIYTFSLSATRTVNLYVSASNALTFQLVDLDPHTLEPLVYTAYSLNGATGYSNDYPAYGVGVPGDDSRFLVFFTTPAGTAIVVQGVRITDTTAYPAVSFDYSSNTNIITGMTDPCVNSVGYAGLSNTYYVYYTDDNALQVKALTATTSLASWTITVGTVSQVDTDFAGGECFVASSAVVTSTSTVSYVAITRGGGASTENVETNVMALTGTTWTAINTANDLTILSSLSTSGSRHQTVALPGGTQFAVGLQASAEYVYGNLYSFGINTATLVVSWVDADELPAVTFLDYEGYFVSMIANPDFGIVNLGGNSTYQRLGICWQSAITTNSRMLCSVFVLNAGAYSSASDLIPLTNYLPGFSQVSPIHDTTFHYVYTAVADGAARPVRYGVVSLDEDNQLFVMRSKGKYPIGRALTDAAAGEAVTVVLRGCIQDEDLYPYTTDVELCAHGDGSLLPNSYYSNGIGSYYQPICACAHLQDNTVHCDYMFTRSSNSPYYNSV